MLRQKLVLPTSFQNCLSASLSASASVFVSPALETWRLFYFRDTESHVVWVTIQQFHILI